MQHAIEAAADDKLHDIIGEALVLAHAENGHDVGVMQPPGGFASRRNRAGFPAREGT